MLFYDIEIYSNYALVGFLDENGLVRQYDTENYFSDLQINKIKRLLKFDKLVGFNSNCYDDNILLSMLNKNDVEQLYKKSIEIILNNNFFKNNISIDLIEVAPSQASLKAYGARLNFKKLQDLPFEPDKKITDFQSVRKYNINDLELTQALYNKLKPNLSLREKISKQYKVDVMSKSDAQIAEIIIKKETNFTQYVKNNLPKKVTYKKPNLDFKNKDIANLNLNEFNVNDNGNIILPQKTKIVINDKAYNFGLGGLHSQEKNVSYFGNLYNVDVTSYYPSLIINSALYPKNIGYNFKIIYKKLYEKRIKAKKNNDKLTSDVFKLALNGTFGKLSNKYSCLYEPQMLLNVTLTGQLYLLKLIEMLEDDGHNVVSANTDGVEIQTNKDFSKILEKWENLTNMKLEINKYNALFARDVNNYVAIYPNKKVKTKGIFSEPSLSKNTEHTICYEAITNLLSKNIDIEDTIYNCKDISKFTLSRAVKGGAIYSDKKLPNTQEFERMAGKFIKAVEKRNIDYQKQFILKDNTYLGKVVRWYYSCDSDNAIYYKKNGNKVPKSENSKPMMELSTSLPKDLDFLKYIEITKKLLMEIGYVGD